MDNMTNEGVRETAAKGLGLNEKCAGQVCSPGSDGMLRAVNSANFPQEFTFADGCDMEGLVIFLAPDIDFPGQNHENTGAVFALPVDGFAYLEDYFLADSGFIVRH